MSAVYIVLAGIFLPLFPMSMLFNLLFSRLRNPLLRGLMLLIWPQTGLAIVYYAGGDIPDWLILWALFSSLLYALRALALRELGLWISFVATSAWSLLWMLPLYQADPQLNHGLIVGICIPFVMMTLLAAALEKRFGAAYLGLYGGLAQSMPRFTGVLVFVVLGIIATPLFPSFFAMLVVIAGSIASRPEIAAVAALVWLLWSWAGARVIQGLVVGTKQPGIHDIGCAQMWQYILVLIVLLTISVYESGAFL